MQGRHDHVLGVAKRERKVQESLHVPNLLSAQRAKGRSAMNARDTAINLCNWMSVCAEPAGASGAFWRIMGPRRKHRETADGDVVTMRRGIEDAINAGEVRGAESAREDLRHALACDSQSACEVCAVIRERYRL